MPGPIAPGFGIARIEQDQVFSRFRIWVIAIGGMKITDLAGRIFQWGAAEGPAQIERPLAQFGFVDRRNFSAEIVEDCNFDSPARCRFKRKRNIDVAGEGIRF